MKLKLNKTKTIMSVTRCWGESKWGHGFVASLPVKLPTNAAAIFLHVGGIGGDDSNETFWKMELTVFDGNCTGLLIVQ